ncbi:hypothetical protein [Collimonas antrihumi]|uniref:hypothetical protein n=1 Tax=Collimonas antrihumi TaxID=1940615 RepID=UPI001B8D3DEE|nr:hypothetical protein [Collimonas antrihumi]
MSTVKVEMQDGTMATYDSVTRVAEEKYRYTIYGESGVLAVLNKGDLKNLITDPKE